MSASKIAISLNTKHLHQLDEFIKLGPFKNRSQAIQSALIQKLERLEHSRLATECAKLDIHRERELAEEGIKEDKQDRLRRQDKTR